VLLKITLSSIGSAVCTDAVKGLTASHGLFNRKSHDARGNLGKFVALLVCLPIFQEVHFSFKISNTLDQRRLCLLCGKDFFLELYDGGVPSGSIVPLIDDAPGASVPLAAPTWHSTSNCRYDRTWARLGGSRQ
jgi:hypothetical protein